MDINKLYKKYNTSALIQETFALANLSYDQIKQILSDQKYQLESADLDLIIDRLYKAKALDEKVVIVGDYDADGIMATTILMKAFKTFGIKAGFYIPNRLKEGYGINKDIIDLIKERNYSLIVTVDNGVVAFDALDYAKSLNIDVIVSDHHTIDKEFDYDFDYLLHPDYLNEGFNDLCGAGLALLIAQKLLNGKNIGEYYVYAMIATLADMVSVFGFNRNIIKNGLYILNNYHNKHIDNLIHYRNGDISQETISFQVVPKLNSFGRLADVVNVNNIVRYFLLENDKEIEEAAKSITKLNQDRIDMTNDTFKNSNNIKKYGTLNILIDENIHEGITGLIAGRHLNVLDEAVLVLTKSNDLYKGSGRSPIGYDIYSLLNNLHNEFESFGGHKQACGLSFHSKNLDNVLGLISEYSKDLVYPSISKAYLKIDLANLSLDVLREFEKLEPFGVDFKKPLLLVDVDINKSPTVLKEKYLKWDLGNNIELLSFDSNLDINHYKDQKEIKAYVNMSINEFYNKQTINLIVDEFIE